MQLLVLIYHKNSLHTMKKLFLLLVVAAALTAMACSHSTCPAYRGSIAEVVAE